MDLLDRLLGHDSWTTLQLLEICKHLTAEELDQEFDIGHRTVRATVNHIIFNMEVWSDLMRGETPGLGQGTRAEERDVPALIELLNRVAPNLRALAREVSERDGWEERWLDVLDNPPVDKTFGSSIAHLITHSMHHRAQLLYMLRQLGMTELPEGDVFSWEQQHSVSPDGD